MENRISFLLTQEEYTQVKHAINTLVGVLDPN